MSKRAFRDLFIGILSSALLLALSATSALAVPELGLQLNRTDAPLHLGDERLVYQATVSNQASTNPKAGDELTCRGTPEDGVIWGGKPAPTFTYKWLRNGEVIGGATAKTYTVAAADEGKSVQCVVTGTQDPDGGGGIYAPIGVSVASAPVAVDPPPATAAPSGSSRPELSGPPFISATPSGTATATNGSKLLTEAVTTKGTGTLSSGSKTVTGVSASAGAFERQQAITGPGIPAKTRIDGLVETALGVFEITLSNAATLSGSQPLTAGAQPFGVGHEISGECVPADAKIIGATNQGSVGSTDQAIEMDKAATCSKVGAAITATSTRVCSAPGGWTAGTPIEWSFQWLRNGQPIPGATFPAYTVTAEDTEPTSTLQCEAIAEDEEGNRAVAISLVSPTAPRLPAPYQEVGVGPNPVLDFANQTSGPVTLKLVLPDGSGTYAFRATSPGNHWICTKTPPTPSAPATVTCVRSDSLAPGEAYEPVEVVVALGDNPPTTLLAKAEASGGGAPLSALDEDEYTIPLPRVPFGFKAFETRVLDELGDDYAKAGGHPFSAGASIEFNTHARAESGTANETIVVNGAPRVIRTDVPPGFIGNPQALGELCPTVSDVLAATCPASSAVGAVASQNTAANFKGSPLYAIEPERGVPAQFAFEVAEFVFTLVPELRSEKGYAISLVTAPLSGIPEVFSVDVSLCKFGAGVVSAQGQSKEYGCRGANDPGALERPFLTLPTRCGDPASATTTILADSWEDPGNYAKATHTLKTPEGCENLEFAPELEARPTTRNADSPTGLDFNLHIPQNEDPEGLATAHLKQAVVTLPEGLAVNPSGANGLGACSEAEVGMSAGVPDNEPVHCPDAAKIGAVQVTTPILDHPLPGALYIATPHQNPFGSLLALYLVVDSPDDGITIKLAGRVEADKATGRLTTSFDQNPQAPVEDVRLTLRSGAAAPLRTPAACGKYTTAASLTPWSAPDSGPPADASDGWQINRSAAGAACEPTPPNTPAFEAGAAAAIAGAHSPFVLKLSRADGSQQFSSLSVTPPPGLLATLAGTAQCSEAALAAAASKSGREEQSSPSCPPASEVGSVIAAAGAGPAPYQATGKAYLTGPYKGAPLSIAIITPALAGPFDLGNVVIRSALHVDPVTAQVTVRSDPLPEILEGIPLDIRSATVAIDRPNFTLNPTSCDEMAVKGELLTTLTQTASLSNRFQLAECDRLGFKPRLALKLKGETRRTGHPGLLATLKGRPGDANIAYAQVTLPPSAFVENAHIRTICTRVQFAADQCPPGSVYGKATATTPLLDDPLTGNVYLRSSDNPLPDLVVALKGPESLPVEVELAGRTDSAKGALRNTFAAVPDAPVSSFRLQLFGGRKGLIVNSKNLCRSKQRARVRLLAQNGRVRELRPLVGNGCGGKKRGKGRRTR